MAKALNLAAAVSFSLGLWALIVWAVLALVAWLA